MTARSEEALSLLTSSRACLMGKCLEERHPEFEGRFRVAYSAADGRTEAKWLAALEGVAVREGDHTLLLWPANWPEPIIVGVLPGTSSRDPSTREVTLAEGETLRIAARDGGTLAEVTANVGGPVLRLCQEDVRLELPGNLDIAAGRIRFATRSGDVQIDASGEVVVQGKIIRLN